MLSQLDEQVAIRAVGCRQSNRNTRFANKFEVYSSKAKNLDGFVTPLRIAVPHRVLKVR